MGIWQERGLMRAEQSQIGWDFDKAGHAADRMQVLTRHSLAEMLLMSEISST